MKNLVKYHKKQKFQSTLWMKQTTCIGFYNTVLYRLYKSPARDKESCPWTLQITMTLTERVPCWFFSNPGLKNCLESSTLGLSSQSGAYFYNFTITIVISWLNKLRDQKNLFENDAVQVIYHSKFWCSSKLGQSYFSRLFFA